MEHDSSFNGQLKKRITARAVMIKKIRLLQADIDKKNEKIDEISREIRRIKKTIRSRRKKNQDYRELSLRLNELKNVETEIRQKIEALEQINSHIEYVKDQVIIKIKRTKKKSKIFSIDAFSFPRSVSIKPGFLFELIKIFSKEFFYCLSIFVFQRNCPSKF